MKKYYKITTHQAQTEVDRTYWRSRTPEERLDELERLRLEAGRFLFEYPARMKKVIAVRRMKSR